MKEMAKDVGKMNRGRPKLIRQHMCVESRAQEPDYPIWHEKKDPEKLWQAIVKTLKGDSTRTYQCTVSSFMTLTEATRHQELQPAQLM
jgi:hypothetical protein